MKMECTFALLGKKQEALSYLKQVMRTAFQSNHDWISRDPDLLSLQGDPEFEALMKI